MRKGDTTLRLIDKAASLKKLIKKVEKRKVCLGGTDLERELAKALDIMADVVLVQGCAMNIVRKMQNFLMFSKISISYHKNLIDFADIFLIGLACFLWYLVNSHVQGVQNMYGKGG